MAKRTSYDKDGMVAKTTDFNTVADPAEGAALAALDAAAGGCALAVAWVWDAAARGSFYLQVNGENRYAIAAPASGGANVTRITGRVDFNRGDTVRLVAAESLTGTFSGAIIYAEG